MKYLVTGCAGFIGSHLIERLLQNGNEVIGIDCFTEYYSKKIKKNNLLDALKSDRFIFLEKDLLKIEEYPEVDIVFHMAAQAGVGDSWGKNFSTYTSNNIETTQKLLEYYKDFDIKKFIYSSSSSVYGDAKLPMNEESILKPVSPYGVSKLAGENLCYLYWKNYNVPTISLRYFSVYGPRQRPDMAINKFVSSILNKEKITIYGDGEQTRDFTFIDDIIDVLILSNESHLIGEIFNVGGGSRISVNQLIKTIEEITGKKAILEYLPKQKGDALDTEADLTKIKNSLRWKPQININEGLKRYVKWYRDINGR